MTYRHSFILVSAVDFLKVLFRIRQVSSVHPTTSGSVVIIHDDKSDVTYKMSLDVVRSEKKVDSTLYLSEALKVWGLWPKMDKENKPDYGGGKC